MIIKQNIMGLFLLSLMSAFAGAFQTFDAGYSGSLGGREFYWLPPRNFQRIVSMEVCADDIVYGLGVTYENFSAEHLKYGFRGSRDGQCHFLVFAKNEYVTEISGRSSGLIEALSIKTNLEQTLVVGQKVKYNFSYQGDDQFQIAGFKGRSGTALDAIGVIYLRFF